LIPYLDMTRPQIPAPGRRHWLQAAAVSGAALLAYPAARANDTTSPKATPPAMRSPFVLIHGAWHGGWCWRKLTPLLQQAGHTVHTPTLTGLGERAHLAKSTTGLEDHVQDLLAVLEMEDLHDVTLVGHSYAGFLIGTVAARASARVRQLVYLDAFVPEPGQRLVDQLLPAQSRPAVVAAGEANGFIAPIPLKVLGVTDEADLAWMTPRLVRQPWGSFTQPALEQASATLPRGYIACTQPASGSFGPVAARVRQDPAWRFQALATGHDAMVTAPRMLADVLLRWAA
jgi:pimeloyl-ACP methyl ester carboxylesterase